MKKSHFIAFLVLITGIWLVISASKDASTYSNFSDAENTNGKVKVIGELVKDKEMIYNPEENPNYFSFYVIDDAGVEKKVILHSEKPQDFELSEKIVMTGEMKEDQFIASELLLKCPSKYKDEEIAIKAMQDS